MNREIDKLQVDTEELNIAFQNLLKEYEKKHIGVQFVVIPKGNNFPIVYLRELLDIRPYVSS